MSANDIPSFAIDPEVPVEVDPEVAALIREGARRISARWLSTTTKDEVTAEFIRGERKLGEFWKDQPKNDGGGDHGNQYRRGGSSKSELPAKPPTLSDFGLDKKRAARDACFADLEERLITKHLRRHLPHAPKTPRRAEAWQVLGRVAEKRRGCRRRNEDFVTRFTFGTA